MAKLNPEDIVSPMGVPAELPKKKLEKAVEPARRMSDGRVDPTTITADTTLTRRMEQLSMESMPEEAEKDDTGNVVAVLLDTAATLGANAAISSGAGLAGLGQLGLSLVKNGANFSEAATEAAEVVNNVTGHMYQPTTVRGEMLMEAIAWPFEKLTEHVSKPIGDKTMDVTNSPIASTVVYTTAEFIPDIITARVGKASVTVPGSKVAAATANYRSYATDLATKHAKQVLEESVITSKNVKNAVEAQGKIKGFEPNLGQVVGGRVSRSTQKEIDATDPISAETKWENNLDAIETYSRNVFGSTETPGGAALRKVDGDIAGALDMLANDEAALNQKIVKLGSQYEAVPEMRFNTGRRLREEQNKLESIKRDQAELLYAPIADVNIPMKKVWSTLRKINADTTLPKEYIPAPIKNLWENRNSKVVKKDQRSFITTTEESTKLKENMTFGELRSHLQVMKAARRSYNASDAPEAATASRLLGEVIDHIEGSETTGVSGAFNDAMADSSVAASAISQYNTAKAFYREEVINRFEKGPAGQVNSIKKDGTFSVIDSSVVDEWIAKRGRGKGAESSVVHFEKTFGQYAQSNYAWQQLRHGVIQKFQELATTKKDGITLIDTNKVDKFLLDYTDVVDSLPGLRSELQSPAAGMRALTKLKEQVQHNKKMYSQALLVKAAGKGIDTMLPKAIESSSAMTQLVQAAGRLKGGRDGLKASIADHIYKNVINLDDTTRLVNTNKLNAFIKKNEESLRIGLGDAGFKNLQTIQSAYNIMHRSPVPTDPKKAKVTALEAIGESVGQSPSTLLAQWRQTAQGRDSTHNFLVRFFIAGKIAVSKRQIMKAEKAMFNDPNIANTLHMLAKSSGELNPRQGKRLIQTLFEKGIWSDATTVSLMQGEGYRQQEKEEERRKAYVQ